MIAAGLLLGACTARTDTITPELRQGTVQLTSRRDTPLEVSVPEPIKLGKNELVVDLRARAGAELLQVSALMPAHGHGSKPPTIERTAEGTYRVRELILYMSGRWELRFALRVGGTDDEALATVDVP